MGGQFSAREGVFLGVRAAGQLQDRHAGQRQLRTIAIHDSERAVVLGANQIPRLHVPRDTRIDVLPVAHDCGPTIDGRDRRAMRAAGRRERLQTKRNQQRGRDGERRDGHDRPAPQRTSPLQALRHRPAGDGCRDAALDLAQEPRVVADARLDLPHEDGHRVVPRGPLLCGGGPQVPVEAQKRAQFVPERLLSLQTAFQHARIDAADLPREEVGQQPLGFRRRRGV
jgi:hypothetical protein